MHSFTFVGFIYAYLHISMPIYVDGYLGYLGYVWAVYYEIRMGGELLYLGLRVCVWVFWA